MYKYLLIIISLTLTFNVDAQVEVEAKAVFNEFLLPNEGGVFRGLDFESDDDELKAIEYEHDNIYFKLKDLTDDLELYYEFVLSFENSETNYAKIIYTTDYTGIYDIVGLVYLDSDELTSAVFQEFMAYYTDLLGKEALIEDTFVSEDYLVSLIVAEDNVGKYFFYRINYRHDRE